jgi:hypothetical protein
MLYIIYIRTHLVVLYFFIYYIFILFLCLEFTNYSYFFWSGPHYLVHTSENSFLLHLNTCDSYE